MKHRNLEALVLVFAMILLLAPSIQVAVAMPVQHTLDWDFAPYPSYYSDWATAKRFIVGEKLIFSYDSTIHNVQQVSVSDYATCNNSRPIQEYGTGEDVLTLTKPGTYYFICGFSGHCSQGGMLMKVPVEPGPPSPPESPPPPPNHPPPPPRHPPPPPPPPSPPPRHRPPPPRHPPPPPRHSPPSPLFPPSQSPQPESSSPPSPQGSQAYFPSSAPSAQTPNQIGFSTPPPPAPPSLSAKRTDFPVPA